MVKITVLGEANEFLKEASFVLGQFQFNTFLSWHFFAFAEKQRLNMRKIRCERDKKSRSKEEVGEITARKEKF